MISVSEAKNIWAGAGPASLVECTSTFYADGRGFDPPARQYAFMEICQEIISTAIADLSTVGLT